MGLTEEIVERAAELSRDSQSLVAWLDRFAERAATRGKIVDVSLEDWSYMFVGDVHGDLDSLIRALREAEARGYPHSLRLVFLGDYVDRGPHQIEAVTVVLLLLSSYPDSTIALRGNHEPPLHLVPHPHDLPVHLARRLGRVDGSRVYSRLLKIFELLPLAALGDWGRLVALHGGLPTRGWDVEGLGLREYLGGESESWVDAYTEILWNDPIESDVVRLESPRGVGYLWGRPVTEAAKRRGVELVVRGHEPCEKGYKLNHGEAVLTLFSRKGPPYFNERACVYYVEKPERGLKFDGSGLICW